MLKLFPCDSPRNRLQKLYQTVYYNIFVSFFCLSMETLDNYDHLSESLDFVELNLFAVFFGQLLHYLHHLIQQFIYLVLCFSIVLKLDFFLFWGLSYWLLIWLTFVRMMLFIRVLVVWLSLAFFWWPSSFGVDSARLRYLPRGLNKNILTFPSCFCFIWVNKAA